MGGEGGVGSVQYGGGGCSDVGGEGGVGSV